MKTKRPARDYSRKLITSFDPSSAIAEAYRMLRTNVVLAMDAPDDRLGTILVTSAGRGEGKSLTCANLGLILAQSGRRVCVLDADLRIPSQHEIFGIDQLRPGVWEALESPEDPERVGSLALAITSNLHLLHAGGWSPHNPAEIVGSRAFARLLATVKSMYDVVLVDCSPVGLVTDATVVSRLVDGVVFLVAYDQHRRKFVRRALDELRKSNANILGTVMNKVPASGRESGAGYLGGEYYAASRVYADS